MIFWLTYLLLWALTLLLSVAVFALLRQHARLMRVSKQFRESQGPAIGERVPMFTLPDRSGVQRAFPDETTVRHVLFIVSKQCSICEKVLPSLSQVADDVGDSVKVWLVAPSDAATGTGVGGESLSPRITVLFDRDRRVAKKLGITHTPFALLLDTDRRILNSTLASDKEHLLWLLDVAPIEVAAGADSPAEISRR